MPDQFPISETFLTNTMWNKFRAQFLAKWVNEEAAAYREIAGSGAYVAVEFSDAHESTTALFVLLATYSRGCLKRENRTSGSISSFGHPQYFLHSVRQF